MLVFIVASLFFLWLIVLHVEKNYNMVKKSMILWEVSGANNVICSKFCRIDFKRIIYRVRQKNFTQIFKQFVQYVLKNLNATKFWLNVVKMVTYYIQIVINKKNVLFADLIEFNKRKEKKNENNEMPNSCYFSFFNSLITCLYVYEIKWNILLLNNKIWWTNV